MSMFHFLNPTREGRGVEKNTPQKKRFFIFFELYFRKFFKFIQLNLLFLAYCVPIVTIGPAIAAMTVIAKKMMQDRHVFLLSDFFDAFKDNFKQSFFMGLIDLVVLFLCSTAITFYYNYDTQSMWIWVPFLIAVLTGILFLFINFYAFTMITTIRLRLRDIIKNAMIFSVIGIKANLIIVLYMVLLGLFLFIMYTPISVLFVLVNVFSTLCFVIVFNVYPVIDRYLIQPQLQRQAEQPAEPQDAIFSDRPADSGK